MSYTEELLTKADEVIPRVTFEDYKSDINEKIMIDVRQFEELQASGTVQGSIHVPKGVIEFRLNNNDDISFDTSVYVFCAVGVRSAIAGYNLKKVGYKKVFNFSVRGSFDNLLEKSEGDQWFNTQNIHPCSIKDFTVLAKKVGFTINETYDVRKNKKFIFPKSPSNIFCNEVLFNLST